MQTQTRRPRRRRRRRRQRKPTVVVDRCAQATSGCQLHSLFGAWRWLANISHHPSQVRLATCSMPFSTCQRHNYGCFRSGCRCCATVVADNGTVGSFINHTRLERCSSANKTAPQTICVQWISSPFGLSSPRRRSSSKYEQFEHTGETPLRRGAARHGTVPTRFIGGRTNPSEVKPCSPSDVLRSLLTDGCGSSHELRLQLRPRARLAVGTIASPVRACLSGS